MGVKPRRDKSYRGNKKAIILSSTLFPKIVPFTTQLQEKRQSWRGQEWSKHNVAPQNKRLACWVALTKISTFSPI
jgi:hypothetical protein